MTQNLWGKLYQKHVFTCTRFSISRFKDFNSFSFSGEFSIKSLREVSNSSISSKEAFKNSSSCDGSDWFSWGGGSVEVTNDSSSSYPGSAPVSAPGWPPGPAPNSAPGPASISAPGSASNTERIQNKDQTRSILFYLKLSVPLNTFALFNG